MHLILDTFVTFACGFIAFSFIAGAMVFGMYVFDKFFKD